MARMFSWIPDCATANSSEVEKCVASKVTSRTYLQVGYRCMGSPLQPQRLLQHQIRYPLIRRLNH